MQTPCTKRCLLGPEGECLGCGRRLEDIARWSSYTDEQRAKIAAALQRPGRCNSPTLAATHGPERPHDP